VFLLAAVIRIFAAFNDLWLDEIWSIELVREFHSALGAFTQAHHDNNHYLNSLFIYFLGQHGNWPAYRILSELTGIGTVVLAWFIGARENKASAFFSMLVVALSYVLILYSSEARGYSSLIFFCFACFLILQSLLARPRWELAALFSLFAVLGLTSHLTFLVFIAGSLPWFCLRLYRRGLSVARIALWAVGCYGVAFGYLVALYLVDVRRLQIGGGTPMTVFEGYRAMLAWTLGGSNTSHVQYFTAIGSIIIFAAGLALLIRKRSDQWLYYVGTILIAPLAMALVDRGTLHYVRYFIVALGFLLLLFGRLLGWLFETNRLGKIAAIALSSAFVALNSWSTAALLKFGRGHTADAVKLMVNESRSGEEFSFGGEQDFRTEFILGFYRREVIGERPAAYYDHDHWPLAGPEWVVFHGESFREPVPPGKHFTDKFGNWYELVRTFPTAPLSGVHLFIYRKMSPPPR
jgi:hypothetical protein